MATGNIVEKAANTPTTEPAEDSLLYNPQPDGNGGFTDNFITLATLRTSLEELSVLVSDLQSPFDSTAVPNILVDTRNGPVSIQLPANPVAGKTRRRFLPIANSYETNALTITRNGKLIGGVADDLLVDVNGAAFEMVFVNDDYGWAVISKGASMYFQRSTITGADVVNKRIDNSQNILSSIADVETLIVGTSDLAGNFQLPDSAAADDKFQMSFVQEGDGAKTFVIDPQSADTILAADGAVTTAGPGALVQIIRLVPGVWLIAGGLI